jgi:hypothetical protein
MTPIGLLVEEDFIKRYPARRKEIVAHAIQDRERRRVLLQETRHLLTWHPIHTTKVVLVTGILTFILAFLVSQVVSIGHWYADAKSWTIPISLPLIPTTNIDIGSHVPSSTSLALASRVPSFGLQESLIIAIIAMAAVLLEKVVVSLFQWKKAHLVGTAVRDLDQELRTLHEWRSAG